MKLRRQRSKSWAACCSVTQSCLILCDPMDCSTPGFLVLHHLLEFAQTQCPLSQWCHPTISSSVVPFSSCLQSFTYLEFADQGDWHEKVAQRKVSKSHHGSSPSKSLAESQMHRQNKTLWSLLTWTSVVVQEWWCSADQSKQRNKAQPDKKTHQ